MEGLVYFPPTSSQFASLQPNFLRFWLPSKLPHVLVVLANQCHRYTSLCGSSGRRCRFDAGFTGTQIDEQNIGVWCSGSSPCPGTGRWCTDHNERSATNGAGLPPRQVHATQDPRSPSERSCKMCNVIAGWFGWCRCRAAVIVAAALQPPGWFNSPQTIDRDASRPSAVSLLKITTRNPSVTDV